MKRIVILNPKSNNGKSLKAFHKMIPTLYDDLGEFVIYETTGPHDCTRKVKECLHNQHHNQHNNLNHHDRLEQIIIAGGDGTFNEAINGYFEKDGTIISTSIPLGLINLGTGGDFIKTLQGHSKDYRQALIENRYEKVDCGVTYLNRTDDPHYFINISSIGMGGEVNASLKSSKFQFGKLAYLYHTLRVLFLYQPVSTLVRIKENNSWKEIRSNLVNFFICNAMYCGGGMIWAPYADLFDGKFDLVLVSKVPKWKAILDFYKMYNGKIADMVGTTIYRGEEIEVRTEGYLSQDVDGEIRNMRPESHPDFYFKVIPKSIPINF